jgi:hypothetical protein
MMSDSIHFEVNLSKDQLVEVIFILRRRIEQDSHTIAHYESRDWDMAIVQGAVDSRDAAKHTLIQFEKALGDFT